LWAVLPSRYFSSVDLTLPTRAFFILMCKIIS
jgi:hypothetical protein